MSDNNKNKQPESKGGEKLEKFALAICAMVAIFTAIGWTGLKKIKFKSFEFQVLFFSFLFFAFTITYADYHYLKWLHWMMPSYFTDSVVRILRTIPRYLHFSFVIVFAAYTVGIILGFREYAKSKKLQKKVDGIGLANANGDKPKVIREIQLDDNKSKLLITANGVGLERFEAKKGDLEPSLGRIIESIAASEDRQTIEVNMCKRELRKIVSFYEAMELIKKPYHFVIGDSVKGIMTADLRELPHLLIAGSTGGGKSVFFRLVFLTLIKFSRRLQVYLIDLKRGVEVAELSQFPNTRVAKNESEAVQLLEAINQEMQERFKYMETNNIKTLDPELHKRDLMVVGIDEASVLFSKSTANPTKNEMVKKAKDLTDEIAKLGRAAGIHLVIATQKPIKESLDTKVLENLIGKMVFKMATIAGSNVALGNAKAHSLPEIKGRGIWAGGNKYIEVQAPFLSDKDFKEMCKELSEEMKKKDLENFQPMIDFGKVKAASKNAPSSAEIYNRVVPS